jgi:cell division cycle 14
LQVQFLFVSAICDQCVLIVRFFLAERLLFGCFSQVPAKNPQHHYFNVDSIYTYEPVVSEWGPLTISQIVRFGRDIDAKMKDSNLNGKIIYFWSGAAPTQRTNAALLISAYMLLFHEQTPEQAHKPLESMKLACIPFRDASNMPRCTYKLTVLHCLQAIDKARRAGMFDHRTFDVDRFDYYSYPGHGDVSEIVPGKIYAFSGPTHMSKESRFTLQFSPGMCQSIAFV